MFAPLAVYPTGEVVFFNSFTVSTVMPTESEDFKGNKVKTCDLSLVGRPALRVVGRLDNVLMCLSGDPEAIKEYEANIIRRIESGALRFSHGDNVRKAILNKDGGIVEVAR